MNNRKALTREYKERKLLGGVYTITNTVSGKYLLGHTASLASVRSRFEFAVKTESAVHPRLRADWAELGGQAFALDVLEELEQRDGQSQTEFLTDLQTLEDMWREKLDASKLY